MQEVEFDLTDVKVLFGVPAYRGHLPVDSVGSFLGTYGLFRDHGVKCSFLYERENALVDFCRNRIVRDFLERTKATKLFFLDDDIIWKPKDALRLLCLSTLYPMVAATYPVRQDEPKFYVQFPNDEVDVDEYGLLKSSGLGLGFTIIDRNFLQKVYDSSEGYDDHGTFTRRVFKTDVVGEKIYGEDMWFFQRCYKEFRTPVMVDPNIHLRHFGNKAYEHDFNESLQQSIDAGVLTLKGV